MLSIIICEDEPAQTTLLAKLVQQWADQCALPVQILSYPNAESFLFSYEEQPFGDILLLDIQMAQMNGKENPGTQPADTDRLSNRPAGFYQRRL